MKNIKTIGLFVVLNLCLVFTGSRRACAEPSNRPAILFCGGSLDTSRSWVDLTYLAELRSQGFEVDFTNSLKEVTAERIQHYNVLILYTTPDGFKAAWDGEASDPKRVDAFVELIENYVKAGGGVLLMPTEANWRKQVLYDLTERWGAKLPVEDLQETDPSKIGYLSHSAQPIQLAYTAEIPHSPLSSGVNGLWYPVGRVYNSSYTGPLVTDSNWTVVARASSTAVTKPIDIAASDTPDLIGFFQRAKGETRPAFAAIRELGLGRVALINQWRMFSIANGTQWLFNREVLSRGLNGKRSDFGQLLLNTFQWLAEPSLQEAKFGGYKTPQDRLIPQNLTPDALSKFQKGAPSNTNVDGAEDEWRNLRGIIGAKTTFGGGHSTVAQYATAAAQVGLDFVIFLDDFEQLTPASLRQLSEDCHKYSTPQLQLLPGYTIRNNIGNRMMIYGPNPPYPPANWLGGTNHRLLLQQQMFDSGKFNGTVSPAFSWLLYTVKPLANIGFFDFGSSPAGMRLPQLRLFSAAGVMLYRDGRLVEDVTPEYLTTTQGTLPPNPVAVNELTSAADLCREAVAERGLTYAKAPSPSALFEKALHYSCVTDGFNVSASSGPVIKSWSAAFRVFAFGSEEFVTGPNIMKSLLHVTSARGLKEICVYNGEHLYRRFLPGGAGEFRTTLILDGAVMKDLVVVAEDMAGEHAVSSARRCWPQTNQAPEFCSDHINDPNNMLLARGPFNVPLARIPTMPKSISGFSWDGGPKGVFPLAEIVKTYPVLSSNEGTEDGLRMLQEPLLDFCDEAAVGVSSRRENRYSEKLEPIVNPWRTWGPTNGGKAELFTSLTSYTEFGQPLLEVVDKGLPWTGVRYGTVTALFQDDITFQKKLTVHSLRLCEMGQYSTAPITAPIFCITGKGEPGDKGGEVVELTALNGLRQLRIGRGDWFALYSTGLRNSQLFINCGAPLIIEILKPRGEILKPGQSNSWFLIKADLENACVKKGEHFRAELLSVSFPLDQEIRSRDAFTKIIHDLSHPTGLQVIQGTLKKNAELIQCSVSDGYVELEIPRQEPPVGISVPVVVTGLNSRWTAMLWQKEGYVRGYYGKGDNRLRELGIDEQGCAYLPIPMDLVPLHHSVIGHPVVADSRGKELFIQVTRIKERPYCFHVEVNNPTDQLIVTRFSNPMNLPGLELSTAELAIAPGESLVLKQN